MTQFVIVTSVGGGILTLKFVKMTKLAGKRRET